MLAWLAAVGTGCGMACPPARAQDRAQAVAETTLAILSFARWPADPPSIRLCVVGPAAYAGVLLQPAQAVPATGRAVLVRRQTVEGAGSECEALYVAALPQAQLDEVFRRIAGQAILTIHERREDCVARGMFCLDTRLPRVRFDVNLDSLARSGVRVHPGVLQMGRPAGGPP